MSLRVLAEYPQAARADEAHALRLDRGTPVWVREVMMSIDGLDCVVARSLTPMRASRSTWQGMRRLRTRPLADMLYHDRTVRRSAFECRRLAPGVPFHATARDAVTDPGASPADAGTRPAAETPHDVGRILARRSVFWRHGQPLLVAEGFLPGFWDKAGTRRAP
jgi:chorismate--pyruvate lyase